MTKFKVDVLANTQSLGPRLPHLVDADQRGRPGDVEGEDAPVLVQVAPLQMDRLTLSTTPLSILPLSGKRLQNLADAVASQAPSLTQCIIVGTAEMTIALPSHYNTILIT